MCKSVSTQIFQGVEGFSGFFQAFSGEQVTISFARRDYSSYGEDGEGIGDKTMQEGGLDEGFLVQQYTAQWQRPVSIERVLNRTKPVAMVGAGTGTLNVQGLMGSADGMESLLQSDEVCEPLTAIIRGAASFSECDDEGDVNKSGNDLIITLTNVIPQAITVTGSAQNQGIMLQTANAQFQFGGFKIG